MAEDIVELVRKYTVRRGQNECWPWKGRTLKKDGRGTLSISGKTITAPRAVWLAHHNESPPPHLFVCHSCDNPNCVNPAHLWLGTNRDNLRDAGRKGRLGPKTPQARENFIRLLHDLHTKNIGRRDTAEMRARKAAAQQRRRQAEREARYE